MCDIVKSVQKERNGAAEMNQNFLDAVEENPVIAAIKSPEDLKECCGSRRSGLFLSYMGTSVLLERL